jgi:hypothetical protein
MGLLDDIFDNSPEVKMAKKLGISKADVQKLFSEFDADGSGSIDSPELQAFAASLGIFWSAEETEAAVTEMDSDGNGSVDIGEFATWFCRQPVSDGGSDMLKMKLQAKLLLRKIAKSLQEVKDSGEGNDCSTEIALNTGSLDKDSSPGMTKAFFCASSPEEMTALGAPEGAKIAVFIDFTLKEGASDDDIAKIVAGADQAFSMFVEPMLEQLPPVPSVPGMSEAKPYDSHSITKVNVDGEDVLRAIVFSGLDPASLYRETGLELGTFIPAMHVAFYKAWCLSGFIHEGAAAEGKGMKIKDIFNMSMEFNLKWNTRTLKAVEAVLKSKPVQSMMNEAMGDRDTLNMTGAYATMRRAFRSKNFSAEFNFNGYDAVAKTLVKDFFIPKRINKKVKRGDYTSVDQRWSHVFCPAFTRAPTDEEVDAAIDAFGNISAKTFGNIRSEFLAMPPIIPLRDMDLFEPLVEMGLLPSPDDYSQSYLCSPLYPVKAGLSAFDEGGMLQDFVAFKDMGLAILRTVAGIKNVQMGSEVAKGGLSLRGMDFMNLLPTEEEIMASTISDASIEMPMFESPAGIEAVKQWKYVSFVMAEVSKFANESEQGKEMPAEMKEMFAKFSYTEDELAEAREKFSELIDLGKTILPVCEGDYVDMPRRADAESEEVQEGKAFIIAAMKRMAAI